MTSCEPRLSVLRVSLLAALLGAALSGPASAVVISGQVVQWVGGSPGHLPTESGVNGATVIVGVGLDLVIGVAGNDTVKGSRMCRTGTDSSGRFSLNIPAGLYGVVYWKAGFVPAVDSLTVDASTPNALIRGNIDVDRAGQNRHMVLAIEMSSQVPLCQNVPGVVTTPPEPQDPRKTARCTAPAVLFNNWNTGSCGVTEVARGRLARPSTVTKLVFWSDTRIDGGRLSMRMDGPGVAQTLTTQRGACQGPWCEGIVILQQALPAGDYRFTADHRSLCQNGASNGIGYVRFEGCAGAGPAPVTRAPGNDPCAGHVQNKDPFDECNVVKPR